MSKSFKGAEDPNKFFVYMPEGIDEEEIADSFGEGTLTDLAEVNRSATSEEERKTKRVQLVMRPSFFQEVKNAAAGEDMSVNAFITKAIKEYLLRL